METFIVRIYRGTPACARELAGTVERVGTGDRAGFSGRDELLDRLLAPRRRGDDERPATLHKTEEDCGSAGAQPDRCECKRHGSVDADDIALNVTHRYVRLRTKMCIARSPAMCFTHS